MSTVKVTEKAVATEIKSDAYLLGTQKDDNNVERLYRMPYNKVFPQREFELLAEVEITETGISSVNVKKDQNNQALRLKKIFVDCTLAPIDDNEEGSTTYQSGQFSVALFLDNSTAWSFWSLTNAAWKVGTTNYVPLYYWIENKKPMGIMCTATAATYNAAAMGFPVNASRYSEAAEVITGISLNVGSSTLPDMPVGTKFKVWGVKE